MQCVSAAAASASAASGVDVGHARVYATSRGNLSTWLRGKVKITYRRGPSRQHPRIPGSRRSVWSESLEINRTNDKERVAGANIVGRTRDDRVTFVTGITNLTHD